MKKPFPQRAAVPIAAACGALLACSSLQAQMATDAYLVKTTGGQIHGTARPGGGAEFLGIPYAQPPVGDLRWRPSLPAKPWSGVRETTAFGAPCAQPDLGEWNRHDAATGKEDCLFLNVIAPAWPAGGPLPVMFWIHGGANAGGTASSALYKDGRLPEHGIILVTVNYRLSVFGFLAHPELTAESEHHSSGNYGLEDQILALRWVRDNIARFGGDPNNITVFGQSAGAQDTSLLMTSIAKAEFQKAIAESGAAFMVGPQTLAEAEKAGEAFAAKMKAPAGTGQALFLRGLSAEELLKAVMDPARQPRVGPITDGWIIPRMPAQVFADGQESAIPLMIGVTTREFGSGMPVAQLRLTIAALAGAFAQQAYKVYGIADGASGTTDPLYGTPSDQFSADSIFHCPCAIQAAWHSAAHHPTYLYQFDHPIPGQEAQGAVHSADLPYVFGYFPKAGNISGTFVDTDFKLADLMETYWTNFAKTGDPNSSGEAKWEPLSGTSGYLEFGLDGHAEFRNAILRGPQCDLFGKVISQRMKDGE